MAKNTMMEHGTGKDAFKGVGSKKEEFDTFETKKYPGPNTVQGGEGHGVDPFGDEEKKEKSAINMVEGNMFNSRFVNKVEADGNDYPKTKAQEKAGGFNKNKGDHFKTETENADIPPMGSDCGKGSYRRNVG